MGSTAPRRLDEPRSTEDRILETATQLFYAKGFHGVSMREIAEGVGIKAGSLYNWLPGKQELLFRIALDSIRELLEGGRAIVADYATPDERLEAFVRFHVIYHAENRYKAKVGDDQLHALPADQLEQVLSVRDAYESILRQILVQGRDTLGWQIEDEAICTFAIATMCTAVGVWYREDGRLSPNEIADHYVQLALAAVQGRVDVGVSS